MMDRVVIKDCIEDFCLDADVGRDDLERAENLTAALTEFIDRSNEYGQVPSRVKLIKIVAQHLQAAKLIKALE